MVVKISKNLVKQVEREAKKYFKNASGCHDWTHIERVRTLALKIGRQEKADLGIIEIAALLHDIAKAEEMKSKGKVCHAEKGAQIAGKILAKYGLDDDSMAQVRHAIVAHRYRNSHRPETPEAKVLYDADKLDGIGAVGVARDFLFAGNAGSNTLYTGNEKRLARENDHRKYSYTAEDTAVLEYELKLKYTEKKMLTETGKRIARDRTRVMDNFFRRFWQEVKGDK